jgi:hypothetical protein
LLRLGVRLDLKRKAHYVAAFKAALVTMRGLQHVFDPRGGTAPASSRAALRTELESVELNEDRMKIEEWKGRAVRPTRLNAELLAPGQLIDLARSSRPHSMGNLNSHAT